VPRGRLLLLDLFADEHPVWSRTASLYGHPFIWCMLHNFGGNSGMYGALPAVARGVADALATAPSNLVGVGVAPEGIEQNPAVYEFMAELAYEGRAAAAAAPGGLQTWFRAYADRRYAAAGPLPPPVLAALQGAWSLLARSVYSCADGLHNTGVTVRLLLLLPVGVRCGWRGVWGMKHAACLTLTDRVLCACCCVLHLPPFSHQCATSPPAALGCARLRSWAGACSPTCGTMWATCAPPGSCCCRRGAAPPS
jgi:hypothetical protein